MNEGGDDVEDDEIADDEDNDVDSSFPFAKPSVVDVLLQNLKMRVIFVQVNNPTLPTKRLIPKDR